MNIIDINQILAFFYFVEREKGITSQKIWDYYEKLLLEEIYDSLDAKNLAMITYRFSHSKKGSLNFWAMMNERFS